MFRDAALRATDLASPQWSKRLLAFLGGDVLDLEDKNTHAAKHGLAVEFVVREQPVDRIHTLELADENSHRRPGLVEVVE